MQTSKPRNGTSELPNKKSPVSPKPPRASRKSGSDSDSAASKLTSKKTSNERSPNFSDRQSPKHPVIVVYEKKRSVKLSELESQLTQLQEELKKTKEMLSSSESSKQCVQEEAEEDRKQLTIMSAKLEESHLHLVELSKAEDTRLQELEKISQERDKAWLSELESVQKQHTADSTALVCAMNEIQMLKQQLDVVMKSKRTPSDDSNATLTELEALKDDMAAVLQNVQNLSVQIREKEVVEEEVKLVVSQTQKQLEMANATIDTLRAESSNLLESLNSTRFKLEESRGRVSALEEVVKQLQVDEDEDVEKQEPSYSTEFGSWHSELAELRDALEAVEVKYLEEQIRTTTEIQSAYEMAELVKLNAEKRESELESALESRMAENSNFNIRLLDMETAFQTISAVNKELKEKMEREQAYKFDSELKLLKATTDWTELKANLLDKETELQGILEENDILKSELSKRDIEHQNNLSSAISDAEKARVAEEEALKRVDCVNEEAEKSDKRLTKMMEQLQVAQSLNSEMEAELRCLRVQSDQWRKAAEAAAAILSPATNGRVIERIGSMDSDYNSLSSKLMASPFSDDLYDESPKKKNGNVLRKFGGLWKKGTK
ncbi:hypothetical protein HPP92_003220 [Vanilla planifolia]|uniref:Uncharacterized protein n=1 Tax=Vanilla planifolia TaxID=51239 RepID=A0A835SG83_VANPL|nr:hypothetical protein HPP92_003220 [Vanilla planifolia]